MKIPKASPVAWAALVVSIGACVMSATGFAGAARTSAQPTHRRSAHPRRDPGAVVRLNASGKIPAADLPTVPLAKNALRLDGAQASTIEGSCPPTTVDLGSWCLMSSPFPLTNQQIGLNNYFWASQQCVAMGGYLPTAAQLIGAANRVLLESTINDNPTTATVDQDPALGLHDQREMSATLVTTAGGSDAAGSEGVSAGSTGNPNLGQPNPLPQPANPEPQTLQYVTVYSNQQRGGFAGSEPVSQPENFRCAFNKTPGAINQNVQ
jgi:hypothetical protein